ncbi:hypothetical protein PNOK_0039300 [Pyrrhoderma noxium]|uniref:Uncharacterized protein n=1 Tax=Pyrrhoderma noxium TaxID=2282107 RepID=A0A286UV50_9AGAM|nr:hypothetical protein PNOK_0039300 [Pyrrhoderma noxium]
MNEIEGIYEVDVIVMSMSTCSSSFTSTSTLQGSPPPTKRTLFKQLKKLVSSSKNKQEQAPRPISPNTRNRRAEALKSVGLLKQSQVYGPAYRDEDLDDDATISSHETKVAADHFSKKVAGVKDLISFDEIDDDKATISHTEDGRIGVKSTSNNNIEDSLFTPPYSSVPPSMESDRRPDHGTESKRSYDSPKSGVSSPSNEVVAPNQDPSSIQIRRQGSISAEVDKIDDEESRHLTEVAFLY